MDEQPVFEDQPQIVKLQSSIRTELEQANRIYLPEHELHDLEKQFEIHHPRLVCPEQNEIISLCTSSQCVADNALICNSNNCHTCQSLHQNCGAYMKIRFITRQLQEQAEARKRFVLQLYREEEEMIKKIRESRKAEVEKYRLEYLGEKLECVIRKMYVNNQPFKLNSKGAMEMAESLSRVKQCHNGEKQQLVSQFHQKTVREVDGLKAHESKLMYYFSEGNQGQNRRQFREKIMFCKDVEQKNSEADRVQLQKEVMMQSIDSGSEEFQIKQSKSSIKKYALHVKREKKNRTKSKALKVEGKGRTILDSVIIDRSRDDIQFLMQSLGNPHEINLFFRASEHQFSAKKFHAYCDRIPGTLTLITTEFGKRIGGYTPLTWNCVDQGEFGEDKEAKSFLFSLDMKQRLVLKENKKAIHCMKTIGPTFGHGYDIGISNLCHQNQRSYANIGFSYCRKDVRKQTSDPQLLADFCGAPKGCSFRVLEYEVYQVMWS